MSDFQKIMNTLLVFPFCCMFVIVPLQWGSASFESDKKSTAFTYPIEFPNGFISAVAADTGGGAQGFGVTPLDNQHANIYRSGVGYAGSGRLIIIGR